MPIPNKYTKDSSQWATAQSVRYTEKINNVTNITSCFFLIFYLTFNKVKSFVICSYIKLHPWTRNNFI